MSGLSASDIELRYSKLESFLNEWPLEKVKKMTLEEYSNVGDKSTFCYWLEFDAECLGRIGGKPSNKFGIWKRKSEKPIVSLDLLFDNQYAWYKKYGNTSEQAFDMVRSHIVNIIESSQCGNFKNIDSIDLDSLARWKIAFMYSDFKLMPIYKKESIRKIAKHFDYSNYERARFSDLHQFIVNQKPENEDFFVFSDKQYAYTKQTPDRNYYVIGSKYEEEGQFYDISKDMYIRNVISTGYFWDIDFTAQFGCSDKEIRNYISEKANKKEPWFSKGLRTLSLFNNLKPGDLIALKSEGKYNKLTIIAYAVVTKVNGVIYSYDGKDYYPDGLGHTVNVEFLETNLSIHTGLTYGETIHHIIPGEREGHFEKIFGSYAVIEETDVDIITDDLEEDIDIAIEEDRINEKQTEPSYREVSYSTFVSKTHNKLQIAFAKWLKQVHPNDKVRTETNYIDVKRENKDEIFYYEVKPYNSAYSCIRTGIGQLLDYNFSNPSKSKTTHLVIVGNPTPTIDDMKFIDYIKSSLNISFDYISFKI